MSYRSPQELVEAFRDWGITVKAYEPDGAPWYSHTTNGGWDPWGIGHHHTAGTPRLLTSGLSQRAMLRILRNGYTGLPGPLCHGAPSVDPVTGKGVLWLVGWGNVNHAGLIDPTNLNQVWAGEYAGRRPVFDGADGNKHLYALEYMHPGDQTTPWPDELLEVGHRFGAAVADAHGWSPEAVGGSQIEHRQMTRRKIDRSWGGNVQDAVQAVYDAGPTGGSDEVGAYDVWAKKIGGGKNRKAARLHLIQSANAAMRADANTRGLREDIKALADDQAALRAELPEIVEHAAAMGARKALEDGVVTATVDVNVNGKVAS